MGPVDRQGRGATPVTLAKANRGGYNKENVKRLRKLGVCDVGLAPRGRTPWEVSPAASEGPTFTSITGDQGPTR